MIKVIIAGSRGFDKFDLMARKLSIFDSWRGGNAEVVSGGAKGADKIGEKLAEVWGYTVTKFPAEWDRYGKSAGYKRNEEMADYADVLCAFWDGTSRGTKHMIDVALRKGLETHVWRY